MKNFHNLKYIYSYFIFIIFFLYLFLNTGLHGDDYALIIELQNKVNLLSISAENLGKYIYNIPSYFIWHSIDKNEEFITNFTKKIFRQVSVLF